MAAPTLDSSKLRGFGDNYVNELQYSSITGNESFTATFDSDAPALDPTMVTHVVTTRPTDNSNVGISWTGNNTPGDDNSARTITLSLDTEVGGSMTGAVVRVYLWWTESATGGIS
jgi:hypothetical protein